MKRYVCDGTCCHRTSWIVVKVCDSSQAREKGRAAETGEFVQPRQHAG